MRNLITKILLITFISICGCSSSSYEWSEWSENKDYYQIFHFYEKDSFYDYDLITLMNYKHKVFHVLSKERSKNEKPPFEKYEIIKNGFYYKLKINKIDSIVVLKARFNLRGRGSLILDENINDKVISIWSDDTLLVPGYTSKNIFGKYIEILE